MAAPIGPGDWVECIAPRDDLGLRAGLYCVEEVVPPTNPSQCDFCVGGCGGLLVRGVWLPVAEGYWCARRFRPIYRPKSDFIEQLKRPLAEPVRDLIATE